MVKKGGVMGKNKDVENLSIYEASDFWDEHDFSEFDDVEETSEIRFSIRKKKYIGIDEDLFKQITTKAKILKRPEEALIHEWLSEKAGT